MLPNVTASGVAWCGKVFLTVIFLQARRFPSPWLSNRPRRHDRQLGHALSPGLVSSLKRSSLPGSLGFASSWTRARENYEYSPPEIRGRRRRRPILSNGSQPIFSPLSECPDGAAPPDDSAAGARGQIVAATLQGIRISVPSQNRRRPYAVTNITHVVKRPGTVEKIRDR